MFGECVDFVEYFVIELVVGVFVVMMGYVFVGEVDG